MNILDFITNFREKNGEYFFLHGGCYIFARILQVKFGGNIYGNTNHCVLRKNCIFYDITGIIKQDLDIPYRLLDNRRHKLYEAYDNFAQ